MSVSHKSTTDVWDMSQAFSKQVNVELTSSVNTCVINEKGGEGINPKLNNIVSHPSRA